MVYTFLFKYIIGIVIIQNCIQKKQVLLYIR